MATFYADTGNTPARAPRFGGTITRVATFVVPTGFLQASDDAVMYKHPAGAKLVSMSCINNGTGQTVDVGDDGDDNRFLNAVADNDTAELADGGAGLNFDFATETEVKVVFNTADPTPGGVVTVRASSVLTP